MKGIVFLIVRRALREERGEDEAEAVLEEAGLSSSLEQDEDYPDTDLLALFEAAERLFPGGREKVRRGLGRRALGELAQEYPSFFQGYSTVEGFVRDLEGVIHPQVSKLFPEADFPTFWVDETSEAGFAVIYESERELCYLAEGLILGTADRYRQRIQLEQTRCTEEGDPHCRIVW